MNRRIVAAARMLAVLIALVAGAGTGYAQQKEPFSADRFAELQAQSALILLDVYADWCPTCAEQQKVLQAFQEQHPEVELHVLQIDFDSQKRYVRRFRAPRQSTFILYRGTERVWFSVAETDPAVIFAELNEANRDSAG